MKKNFLVLLGFLGAGCLSIFLLSSAGFFPELKSIELQARKISARPAHVPNSEKVQKTFNVTGFSHIDVSSGVVVNYEVGDYKPIILKTYIDIIDKVVIKNDNGDLMVSVKWPKKSKYNINYKNSAVQVYITAPEVTKFKVSSGAIININSPIKTSDFNLEASSGGTVNIGNIHASDFHAYLSSGSIININEFQVKNLNIEQSSGSIINLVEGTSLSTVSRLSSGSILNIAGRGELLKADVSSGAIINAKEFKLDAADIKTSSGGVCNTNSKNVNNLTPSTTLHNHYK